MTEINEILKKLKAYKFTDELGHPLENCVEFQKLVEQVYSIKIWDMDGGITWIAAKTKETALLAMADYFCHSNQSDEAKLLEFNADYPEIKDDMRELEYSEYDTLLFCEDDEYGNERKGEKKTFRQKLGEMIAKNEEFPCFFATSEY